MYKFIIFASSVHQLLSMVPFLSLCHHVQVPHHTDWQTECGKMHATQELVINEMTSECCTYSRPASSLRHTVAFVHTHTGIEWLCAGRTCQLFCTLLDPRCIWGVIGITTTLETTPFCIPSRVALNQKGKKEGSVTGWRDVCVRDAVMGGGKFYGL